MLDGEFSKVFHSPRVVWLICSFSTSSMVEQRKHNGLVVSLTVIRFLEQTSESSPTKRAIKESFRFISATSCANIWANIPTPPQIVDSAANCRQVACSGAIPSSFGQWLSIQHDIQPKIVLYDCLSARWLSCGIVVGSLCTQARCVFAIISAYATTQASRRCAYSNTRKSFAGSC